MKKIVPFTKDLMFKTKIGEITSIALDNTLKLDKENVTGEFIVSGSYKMLEGSTIEEEFRFDLPVDITIDEKYDTSDCKISIDDFYYEIINEERLRVNISVMLDDLEIREDPIENIEVIDAEGISIPFERKINEKYDTISLEEKSEEERDGKEFEMVLDEIEQDIEVPFKDELENIKLEIIPNKDEKEDKDEKSFHEELFENLSTEMEYSIYRVYTMKETDTLDIILDKYNTSKEVLCDYNDLDNIRVGSKIIIPSTDE